MSTTREIKACGVLCFRDGEEKSFLLLKHPRRWDLPKGHIRKGETERDCALREMQEETGILPLQVWLDPDFRFETQNPVRLPYLKNARANKTYAIFIAYVLEDVTIHLTEHESYRWFAWSPPHYIQPWLIDPLLQAVEAHFA